VNLKSFWIIARLWLNSKFQIYAKYFFQISSSNNMKKMVCVYLWLQTFCHRICRLKSAPFVGECCCCCFKGQIAGVALPPDDSRVGWPQASIWDSAERKIGEEMAEGKRA
jgi:hypothetical protein